MLSIIRPGLSACAVVVIGTFYGAVAQASFALPSQPTTVDFHLTFSPLDPNASIHIDPISWQTTNGSVTTGGFDYTLDSSPVDLQLLDPFHGDSNDFTTYDMLGVYTSSDGVTTTQSVFAGFTNGGIDQIGKSYDDISLI